MYYQSFFIYSLAYGHLCYFHFLAVISTASVNTSVQILFETEFSILVNIRTEVELLDHMVIMFLFF